LVNLDQTHSREIVVQTGAYAEHQCLYVETGDQKITVDQPYFTIRLAPGAGTRMVIYTKRYANVPTLTFPWDRVPVVEIR
jgi:hypothetical protein